MATVIIGSGIIGLSTAQQLIAHCDVPAASIHIIESSSEAYPSSSRYAGGFLAKDWHAAETASLGALSFDMHRTLAEQEGGRARWGYAESIASSLTRGEVDEDGVDDTWMQNDLSRARAARGSHLPSEDSPAWLNVGRGGDVTTMSTGSTTAQVDPMRLCEWLVRFAVEAGAHLHLGSRALSISNGETSQHTLHISTPDGPLELPCTRILIAAGAWSGRVFSALFSRATTQLPITSMAGYSLLVKTPRWTPQTLDSKVVTCHAVFTSDNAFSPEMFSRIDGEIYIAGLNKPGMPLPNLASDVTGKMDRGQAEELRRAAQALLGSRPGEEVEIVRTALCHRPTTTTGRPIVARIPVSRLGKEAAPGERR